MLRKRRLCKQDAVRGDEDERKILKIDLDGIDSVGAERLSEKFSVNINRKGGNKGAKGRNDRLNRESVTGHNKELVCVYKSRIDSSPASDRASDSHRESSEHVSQPKFRLDSGYGSDPDESDHLEVMGLETSSSLDEPDCVSPESPWYKGSAGTGLADIKATEGNPFFRGKICNEALIDHPHKTDTPLGDRFGASVLTDPSSGKDGYFRHFFVKVQQASPAYGMHVRNDDEIVLINDRFVPELNHEAIMTLISRVPVDGVTRFKLVLRRLISPPDGKNWIWFETSAVLVPELPEEPRPRATEVRRVPLNNMWDKTTFQRYKVIGTLNYLGICKNGVIMGVLTGDPKTDNSKTICKHAKVCEDPNDRSKFRFVTSLASADKVYYAALNENTNSAFTTKTEVFFDYRKIGSEICFQQNKVYLSCFNNQVCASSQRHMFEEFPTSGHKDVYDRSSYTEHDIGMDDVDGANTSLRGTTKAGKSSPYGTESSANAFLYGANTTQCSTRNGGNTPSCGIPLYMRTAGKMDNPRDSGYGTSSPGDTPPRKIMTRSLSKQLSMTSGLEALSFNDKLSVD